MSQEKIYQKILIPLDTTPTDQVILNHIRPLARLTDAELILVHVADGYGARLQQELNLADSQEINDDRTYLKKMSDQLKSEGFKTKDYLLAGEPAQKILDFAHEQECDLIAMATHGHRFIKDLLLGSVAEHIRHRTSIPILMLRAPIH